MYRCPAPDGEVVSECQWEKREKRESRGNLHISDGRAEEVRMVGQIGRVVDF